MFQTMRKLFLSALLLSFSLMTYAQYWEIGGMAGGSSYMGELQRNNPSLGSFQPAAMGFIRRNFSPRWSAKVAGFYGGFNATDNTASGARRLRGLEVKTTIMEGSASGEFNLLPFDIMDDKTIAPYIAFGGAAAYYNPQARYEGKWIDLRPLGTEGQTLEGGKIYSPIALSALGGLGFKMSLTRRIVTGFEFAYRYSFTDYLDDVSGKYPDIDALTKQNPTAAALSFRMPSVVNQKLENPVGQKRGDSYKSDHYFSACVSLSINIGKIRKLEYNNDYRTFYNLSGGSN
jgi:Domain of unknown function (DUF6089)